MNFKKTEENLKERVKELTCLYDVSKIISQSNQIDKNILKKIISTVKKAWKFNHDAIVEIQVQDFLIATSPLPENTVFQISNIIVPEIDPGFIKVHYSTKKHISDDFLEDEQKLLDAIASAIQNYFSKYKILQKKTNLKRTLEKVDRLSILNEVTAGIAHELNNPLSNILGYAELIKLANTDSGIKTDIDTIINSVIYTREIVKKMMYFSCGIPQQSKIVKIKPIVTFALSFLKQNFQKKEINSELFFKNDTVKAKVDAVQITQVLFNLIINAIHASPQKSTIKVKIDNDNNNLYINIEDHGHGISETNKQKIFEPFFTTKDSHIGSGIGLNVVQGIVKNHNGKIVVQNNSPSGTIFSVILPLK